MTAISAPTSTQIREDHVRSTEPSMEYLARKNAHPRDAMISFDEPSHIYTIRDDPRKYNSVTTLNGELFDHFDAPTVAAGIAGKPDDDRKKIVYHGKTAAQIEAMWSQGGTEASGAGTAMHMDIERFFNGVAVLNPASIEFGYFVRFWRQWGNGFGLAFEENEPNAGGVLPFCKSPWLNVPKFDPNLAGQDVREDLWLNEPEPPREANTGIQWGQPGAPIAGLVPYRTEWCVWYEEYQLAGSIDMIFENPDGTLQIYDWKRVNKDLSPGHPNPRFPKYGIIAGLEDMVDNAFWHYALQLNMYKHILETKYGKKVTALYLLCLHPTHSEYLRVHVPFIPGAIDCVLRYRKAQLQGNADKFKVGPRKMKKVFDRAPSPENTRNEGWQGSDEDEEPTSKPITRASSSTTNRTTPNTKTKTAWLGSDDEEEEAPPPTVTRKTSTVVKTTKPTSTATINRKSTRPVPKPFIPIAKPVAVSTSSTGKYPSAFTRK